MLDQARSNQTWTTAVAALACFLMTLDITVVNVALPSIQKDLGASLEGLQWVVNAYVLAFAALLLTVGSVSDRLGRKRLFLTGVAVFTVASALCVASRTESPLIAARALQGIGGALVFGTCLALIADAYTDAEEEQRRKAVGLAMAAGAAAATLGPLIGGGLVEIGTWQWIFAINVPVGVALAICTALKVREPHAPHAADNSRVDSVGAVVAIVVLFALNYGLLTGAAKGWGRGDVLAALAIGLAGGVGFVLHQLRRGSEATLDLALFRIPTFLAAIVLGFTVRALSFGVFPFLILWLAGAHGRSAFDIGLILSALALPLMVCAVLSTSVARAVGVRATMSIAMVITAAGLFLATLIRGDGSWTTILPALAVLGVGNGVAMPHLMNLAVDVVPSNKAGMATGAANTAFPLGTATGVAAFGVVLSSFVHAKVAASGVIPVHSADSVASAIVAGVLRFPTQAMTAFATSAFTDALRLIFGIAGCAALVAAALSGALITDRPRVAAESPESVTE